MAKQYDNDLKMIEFYENMVGFYESHGQKSMVKHVAWPLELYTENEELKAEIEEMKSEITELEQYIEDHQVSDSKEHLSDYYKGIF